MTPADPPSLPPVPPARIGWSPRRMGLYVFFVSLSSLFAASLVGYLITRSQNATWRTAEMPGLPQSLWLSTILIALMSLTLQGALAAVRANKIQTMLFRLRLGFAGAILFLLNQGRGWFAMYEGQLSAESRSLYAFTFYLLTGLHAAHVLAGLVPLGVVLLRGRQREYSSSRHEGVLLCVQYWHFLGVVWAVLFGALLLAT